MSFTINGKALPPIAVGTWAWGGGANGSKIVFGSKSDPQTLRESFNIAYESGFTLFDTAAVYGMGNAEKLLAEFTDGKDFTFSDKYTPIKKFSPELLDKMYNESISIFKGRIPDIYWLHQPKYIEDTLPFLCQMQKDGKIGSIGVSNFNFAQLQTADDIVKKHGLTVSQTAAAYAISKGTLPIIGITKPYQARELAKTASEKLSNEEILKLETVADEIGVKVKAGWE